MRHELLLEFHIPSQVVIVLDFNMNLFLKRKNRNYTYLWITKLGGPVKGLRPSDKLRPETEPAHEWLLIDPASRRLALSKHNDEAKMLARTLCFDPRRTGKKI